MFIIIISIISSSLFFLLFFNFVFFITVHNVFLYQWLYISVRNVKENNLVID